MPVGRLYLIPTTLGSDNPLEVLPAYNIEVLKNISTFIVEDEKTARRFIKKVWREAIIDSMQFLLLNEHTKPEDTVHFLDKCTNEDIGLMSEAGVPCIADPGNIVVNMAHAKGIEVVPLVGPSSIIMALMASGLNGQNFAFNGYLPIEKPARAKALKHLENRSASENQTQCFIEAPYRNNQLVADMLQCLSPATKLCIACDISLPSQYIKTQSIDQWRKKAPDLHKRPAIFLVGK